MPVVGIGILAFGLADFGRLFFNRRARRKEWEMAVASTFSGHVVLIGLGHLGFRVMQELVERGQDVVVIEQNPKPNLADEARRLNVPVIQDDGQRQETLSGAAVARARAIVLCTQNDVLNLQIAFMARRLNPDIEVVMRIFDDAFAEEVARQFGYRAMSATGMAAPTFAAAATGMDIARPITIEGQAFSLGTLTIGRGARLDGLSVGAVEREYDVSVVLLRRDGHSDHHPAGERQLAAGDVLAVLGGSEPISRLARANNR
jgi:Trk K+ transport system NAD-binding subunit